MRNPEKFLAPFKNPKALKITGIVLILAASGGAFREISSWTEATDDAYTAAHVAMLSPKVGGLVIEVLVEENSRVVKDQVLLRMDPRDFRNALGNLRGELGEVQASLGLAEKRSRRSSQLFAQKALPEQDRDNDSTRVQELQMKKAALEARISQAELNLEFTELRAPSDGIIGKKLVEPGMVTTPGLPLLSFVSAQAPWVVANFKETQLRRIRIGQKCRISLDSIEGAKFEGEVESVAPGTGATFALIPPENATGNFTKIVQRVPVRIRFNAASIRGFEDRILPGLSAEIHVELDRGERGEKPTTTVIGSFSRN